MSDNSTCVICKKDFTCGGIIVTCVCCNGLFHANYAPIKKKTSDMTDPNLTNCAEINASEGKVAEMKSDHYKINRCKKCTTDGGVNTSIFQLFNILSQNLEEIKPMIKDYKSFKQDIPLIKKDLKDVQERVSKIEANELDSVNEVLTRIRKSKNILLHGIIDNNNTIEDGLSISANLIKICHNFNIKSVKFNRLGVFSKDHNRPILIQFQKKKRAREVIVNKHKLLTGVTATLDKTKLQQQLLKKVYAELKERQKKGEKNLIVKFVNNVPTVAVKNTRSTFSRHDPHVAGTSKTKIKVVSSSSLKVNQKPRSKSADPVSQYSSSSDESEDTQDTENDEEVSTHDDLSESVINDEVSIVKETKN